MTQIFAHRGYSAKYPENTMSAFREAEKVGADGIELDVQLSKDGEVVVIHDEKVNRTTNGKGYVRDLSLKELQRLDAGYSLKTIVTKEPIPSLREVLEWMTSNKIICNIELKNNVFRYEGMEEKVIALVRKYDLSQRVIISSFNHYSIVKAFQMAPKIEIAPLFGNAIYMPWVYAKSIRAKGIHPKFTAYPLEILKTSLANEIAVRLYTVNQEKDMEKFCKQKVSAIITDNPVLAKKVLNRLNGV